MKNKTKKHFSGTARSSTLKEKIKHQERRNIRKFGSGYLSMIRSL